MAQLVLEIHEGVLDAIKKLKAFHEESVEIIVPEGSVLFENSLNLKLLKREAEALKKEISFSTSDEAGQTIIDFIEGNGGVTGSDFVSREVTLNEITGGVGGGSDFTRRRGKFPTALSAVPLAFLGSFFRNLKIPRLPQGSFKAKLPVLVGLVISLALLGFGFYQLLWKVPKAEIRVVVNSQPLIKSVEIQVKPNVQNDVAGHILAGKIVEGVLIESKKTPATGEKLVGETAKGKVKLFNYTTSDVELSEGHDLTGEDNDKNYNLSDDVTVPAGVIPPSPPGASMDPGEAEVDVEAEDIGSSYNLDDGESLTVDDNPDIKAQVVEDISGGASDTVKVVAQADIDSLSDDLFAQISAKGDEALKGASVGDQVLIADSAVASLVKEEYNADLDEEVEELELTQTVSFQGLAYNKQDLNAILDDLLKGFVPQGFELSAEERETNVEILGNTDATVLNLSQADLQVTIKAYVIPEVNEEELKQKLLGVSFGDAQQILGKVRNIKTYEIKMTPNIPFLSRLPKNAENILLTVERE